MAIGTLPEDPETERSLLSTICQPGAEAAATECTAALRADDFVHPAHRAIFEAVCSLLSESSEICLTTIRDSLGRSGALGRVGNVQALVEILSGEEVGRPLALVEILQRHRRRRELIRLGARMVRNAQDDTASPESLTEEAAGELARIAQRKDSRRIRHIADVSDGALASVADEMNGVHGNRTWVKGWPRLNRQLGGFQPGQLIVLAARPGVGKTALALNWILGTADYRSSTGIFSLEMPAERLWRRLASAHAGVDLRAMVEHRDPGAFRRVGRAKEELDKKGIWIQDRSGITAREILGEVDGLLALQPDLGLLVVDHLGLISTPETARTSRQSESTRIGDITRAFKILAGDRGIPVLLLTQLNREIEKRGAAARPQLSDLRDSGCVEQDADVVMFIHRKGHEQGDRSATLDIAKHREGPTGQIPMDWDENLTRFTEAERQTESAPVQEPLEFV